MVEDSIAQVQGGKRTTSHVCWMGWRNCRAHLLEGFGNFRACVNVGDVPWVH